MMSILWQYTENSYCRPHFIQPGSKIICLFEERVFAEVAGAKVNRGAGYGHVPTGYMDLRSMLTE